MANVYSDAIVIGEDRAVRVALRGKYIYQRQTKSGVAIPEPRRAFAEAIVVEQLESVVVACDDVSAARLQSIRETILGTARENGQPVARPQSWQCRVWRCARTVK